MSDHNEYWQNPEDTQLGKWQKELQRSEVFYSGYTLLLDLMVICDYVQERLALVQS